jgi:hypothetical protein
MTDKNKDVKLKAVPAGEATVLAEFVAKKDNLSVVFRPKIRNEVMEYYDMIGQPKPFAFKGPDFKDIAGYQIKGPFLVVLLKDDTQYVYPLEDIARIKTYVTKE